MRRWAVAGVALLAGITGLAGVPAGAQAAATTNGGWSVVFRAPTNVALLDISCPTRQACVVSAAGGRDQSNGEVFLTTDGGKVWRKAHVPSLRNQPLLAVACVRGTLRCEATGNENLNTRVSRVLIGTTNGMTWRRQKSPNGDILNDVVCPAKGVCEAVGDQGAASSPPAIARTTDGGKVWHQQRARRLKESDMETLACPTVKVCVAGGPEGAAFTHDGGTKWWWMHNSFRSNVSPSGIACGSPKHCVAVGIEGFAGGRNLIMDSTNGGRSWTRRSVPTAVAGGVNKVACPAATYCVATGISASGGGATIVTTNGGRTWRVQSRVSYSDGLGAIACTKKATCYALGGPGVVRRSS